MKGTLYIQRSMRGKQIKEPHEIECSLGLDKDGIAHGFSGEKVIAELLRARVEFIAADGLSISGVEEIAPETLRYQEWWFVAEKETIPNDQY